MSIKIEAVSIDPNPVSTGEQFIISAKVTLSTWEYLKQFTWQTLKRFTWKQVKDGQVHD